MHPLCYATILLGVRSGVSHESVVVFPMHGSGHWPHTGWLVYQARMLVQAWLAGCVVMRAEVVPHLAMNENGNKKCTVQ